MIGSRIECIFQHSSWTLGIDKLLVPYQQIALASNTPSNYPLASNTPSNYPLASNTPSNNFLGTNTPMLGTNTPMLGTNTPMLGTNTPQSSVLPSSTPYAFQNYSATTPAAFTPSNQQSVTTPQTSSNANNNNNTQNTPSQAFSPYPVVIAPIIGSRIIQNSESILAISETVLASFPIPKPDRLSVTPQIPEVGQLCGQIVSGLFEFYNNRLGGENSKAELPLEVRAQLEVRIRVLNGVLVSVLSSEKKQSYLELLTKLLPFLTSERLLFLQVLLLLEKELDSDDKQRPKKAQLISVKFEFYCIIYLI